MKPIDRFILGALAVGVWTLIAIHMATSYAQEAESDAQPEPPIRQPGIIQASDIIGLDALIERSIATRQRPQSIVGLDQYVRSIVRRCRVSGSVTGNRISSASITC